MTTTPSHHDQTTDTSKYCCPLHRALFPSPPAPRMASWSASCLSFGAPSPPPPPLQMTALGILMSISFVTVSRSKPLEKLSGMHITSFPPSTHVFLIGAVACVLAPLTYEMYGSDLDCSTSRVAGMSGVRPFGSVFHPALFLSILGQFALHLVRHHRPHTLRHMADDAEV